MKTTFAESVYDLTSKIPKGKVTTYGILARELGRPKASRAVGRILGANPNPIVVPCHRVVMGDGTIGGYSSPEGVDKKIRILKEEGVEVKEGRVVDFSRFLFRDFAL